MKIFQYTVLAFLLGVVATGCNNDANQIDQANPGNDPATPQQVGFNAGDNDNNFGVNEIPNRYDIPVRPGREQNIFRIPGGQNGQQAQPDTNQRYQQQNPDQQQQAIPQQEEQNQPQQKQTENQPTNIQAEVIELTNQERQNNGLPPLKQDQPLTNAAQMKSEDMANNNYFSHNSPTYGTPFDMLQSQGIEYTTAAENIARGQQSAQEVVEGWMNSPGHRKNILNKKVTHIGVGYASNGDYWTQLFIKK
ncbi:CAP domain-containing protein [Aquibacillus albus]|uniref:YkwD family protein n=1 Tax=Aquibacillus albus TaxID=1168171 RepID=A0ABS2N394_9BACI|nr:CAP domain-containing protein [Aquibacillus albus]MBM7572583.1 putative YkwD family protein [Aquibacillus albus]